jgi:hypothetical protein
MMFKAGDKVLCVPNWHTFVGLVVENDGSEVPYRVRTDRDTFVWLYAHEVRSLCDPCKTFLKRPTRVDAGPETL